jgi:hypothetical protein
MKNSQLNLVAVASVTKTVLFSDIAPGCDLAEKEDHERNQTATSTLRQAHVSNLPADQKILKAKSSRNKKLSRNKALNSSECWFKFTNLSNRCFFYKP